MSGTETDMAADIGRETDDRANRQKREHRQDT